MTKLAFFYATFPRPTETFVRRELRYLQKIGLSPEIFSIWKGEKNWEGNSIHLFPFLNILCLLFWIPYWAWKRPSAFKTILKHLWSTPCPNLQNWNETFLGLAFALVRAKDFPKNKYSRVHGVWATMPATAAFGMNLLIDIPFSMGAHAYDVFRAGGDWLLPLKIKYASKVRTSSQSTAKRLSLLGLEREKLEIIYRSLNRFNGREHFNLVKKNKLCLLSVGRLVPKKGYFLLIHILQKLKHANIPFQLNIIGGGNLEREIKRQIRLAGLADDVLLLGYLDEAETEMFYRQSDALLFTGIIAPNGDRDGIPNVVPEAMAHGLLVLASIYAGCSEAFMDSRSGYSLSPYKPDAWVNLLSQFYSEPEKFVEVRKSALLHAEAKFSDKVNCQSFKTLFV